MIQFTTEIQRIILMSIVVISVITFSIPHVLGYTTGFENYDKTYGYQPPFTRIPNVCAEQPSDFPTSQGQLDLYMQTIQDRVSEWSSRLQEGGTNVNEWKINYVVFDPQKEPNFDLSSCDILVTLQAIPHGYDANAHNRLGYEYYDSTSGLRNVVVYYEFYKNCGYPPTYSGYACPTGGFLTIPQLSNVLLHELGHALGLGHYVTDDPSVYNAWDTNSVDAPSIMIPYVTVNPDYQHIQEIDVQQVHMLYNYQGFLAFASKSTVSPFDSVSANAYVTNINGDQTPVVSVTANISSAYYNRGDKIYIQITDSKGHQIYDQDFDTTGSFSQIITPQGLVPDTYTLNAVYDGRTSPDVSFVFSNSPPTSPPTNTQIPSPTIPSQTQSNPVLSGTAQYDISVDSNRGSFNPQNITIPAGSTISWHNMDDGIHDIQVSFPSYLIGQSLSVSLNPGVLTHNTLLYQLGNYSYYDEIHPSMTGQIVVISNPVPEFSSLAGMIIVISIIGVIIISKRSRLHFL